MIYDPGWRIRASKETTWLDLGSKWTTQTGNHFVEGSNWIDVSDGLATVGIRSDGTLWVSEYPLELNLRPGAGGPDRLVQFGNETNWRSVVRDRSSLSVLLLKQDGSLWRWGTNHFDWRQKWPGLRAFEPYRLGSESDWAELVSAGERVYAWKKNRQAWLLGLLTRRRNNPGTEELEPGMVIERRQGFDNLKWRSLAQRGIRQAGVLEDGTIWSIYQFGFGEALSEQREQIARGTDWVAVAVDGLKVVGLKADGSLWRWGFTYSQARQMWRVAESPERLGTHNDWLAVSSKFDGIVSLAADGTLWLWPSWDHSEPSLAVSRKPSKLGDIFAP